MEKTAFSERIKEVRAHFGMNKTDFAALAKTQRSALSEFESGNREPSKEFIKTLSDLGISIDWFLTGTGPMRKPETWPNGEKKFHEKATNMASPSPEPPAESAVEMPQREALVVVDGGVEQGLLIPVIAQGLSAGFGFDYEEGEIVRYVKVPAWIARNGRNLVALPVYGNSMEPTISSGDLAVCDSGGFCGDGLYMLRDEERGLMFCKRVIWAPSGWTIKSDNPSYEPMKVEDGAIEVVARVLAAIKEVK